MFDINRTRTIFSSIVDIIRILLVKLVKLFSHIISHRMDFWWIKVFNAYQRHKNRWNLYIIYVVVEEIYTA